MVVEGLNDIAVIASDDAIFVGHLSQAQRVGALVKSLKAPPHHTGPDGDTQDHLSTMGRILIGAHAR